MKKLTALLLGCCLTISSWAGTLPNPIDMLQGMTGHTVAALKEHKASLQSDPSVVYKIIETQLLPYVDTDMMSRSVLGRSVWAAATPQQQKAFQQLFTELLVRTYSTALANYTDETIKFYPLRNGYADKTLLQVQSDIIRSDGPAIPVMYYLTLNADHQWKVYDLSIEGISMLESYRSQFAQEVQNGGMDHLIKVLSDHIQKGNASS